MVAEYEDNYWAEDALFMERNSRDFVTRIARINKNAEAICDCLQASGSGESAVHIWSNAAKHSNSQGSLLPKVQLHKTFL